MDPIATAPLSPRAWNARWQAAFWLLGLAVAGHFLWATAQRYVQVTPEAYGMFWDRHSWPWRHITGGSVAMLAGASQFVAALARRAPLAGTHLPARHTGGHYRSSADCWSRPKAGWH